MPMIAQYWPDIPRRATYQDVLDAPSDMIAQFIDGELHLMSKPALPMSRLAGHCILQGIQSGIRQLRGQARRLGNSGRAGNSSG